MDRKICQTNSEYQKYIGPVWPSSNNASRNTKYGNNHSRKAQRNNKVHGTSVDGKHLTELFHGFQTIKALQKDVFITHLATPNFAENMMKTSSESKTTIDELRLVKENLEKFLLNCEVKSSRRGGKASNEAIAIIPPLLGLKDTILPIVKDQRTSLRELFKTKMSEEKPEAKKTEKDSKTYVQITKKIVKEESIHPSIECGSADEKLHKILHMFERAYPEASAISKKSQNLWKYVTNNEGGHGHKNSRNQRVSSEEDVPYKANSDTIRSNWNRECWIKSDAEFLILEL